MEKVEVGSDFHTDNQHLEDAWVNTFIQIQFYFLLLFLPKLIFFKITKHSAFNELLLAHVQRAVAKSSENNGKRQNFYTMHASVE